MKTGESVITTTLGHLPIQSNPLSLSFQIPPLSLLLFPSPFYFISPSLLFDTINCIEGFKKLNSEEK